MLKWLYLFCIFLGSCAVNPVTGQKELSLTSEAQEIQLGNSHYQKLQQLLGGRYNADEQAAAYVKKVGENLPEYLTDPTFPMNLP